MIWGKEDIKLNQKLKIKMENDRLKWKNEIKILNFELSF